MTEHYQTDSTGVPFSVDPVRTMWPRCKCGAVVPDIDAHIAEESPADLGDYPPMPRDYEQCRQCGETKALRHHCDLQTELKQLRGMVWWLATELAAYP